MFCSVSRHTFLSIASYTRIDLFSLCMLFMDEHCLVKLSFLCGPSQTLLTVATVVAANLKLPTFLPN